MSATDSHAYADAEKDLARFAEAYYESEFVPFPTVADAVECVIETAANIDPDDGRAFVEGVADGLRKWLEEETE